MEGKIYRWASKMLPYILLSFVLIPSVSYATNGMNLIGYGAKSRAMGGTAIALAEDGIYTHSNPAALGNVKVGAMRVDLDGAFFRPERRAACCLAPDGQVSGSEFFLIPSMGMKYKFNRKLSVGMSFVGAGGGSTRYARNLFDAADQGSLGVNLMVAEMSPTAAYRISKRHTIGASPVIAIATFRAYGLGPFKNFSKDRNKITNNGNDWAYGLGIRLGWQGNFFKEKMLMGASYTSRRYMTNFEKYAGLFADDGSFDQPENYGLGLAWKPSDKLIIAFDWTKTLYSNIAAVGNSSLPIVAGDPTSPNALGSPTGPGFGWKDQSVYKLGVQYALDDKWKLRVGANFGESPIPDDDGRGEHEFNVLAPAVTEWHFTLGTSYKMSKSIEFSFAYVHAFKTSQTAFVGETDLPFINQDIELEMRQHSLSAMFSLSL